MSSQQAPSPERIERQPETDAADPQSAAEKQHEASNANNAEPNLEAGRHDESHISKNTNSPQQSQLGRFGEEVSLEHVDLVPLTCALISGFVDSTMFNAYGTFVSMQTGNTIFVALGASNQNPQEYGWAKSLMAVVCFMIGSFCFSRFARLLGTRRRISLVASFLVQSVFVIIAAAITQSGAVDGMIDPDASQPIDWASLAPVALLSFQSSGQVVEARNLGINEVPTVVITSLLCDLWSDPNLFAPLTKNAKRNRRAIAFTLTLLGGIAGGWISKDTKNVATALWLVGALKLVITVAWIFWPAMKAAK